METSEAVLTDEYFEYLDEVFGDELCLFDNMLALCFQYGLSTDEAIEIACGWMDSKEEEDER